MYHSHLRYCIVLPFCMLCHELFVHRCKVKLSWARARFCRLAINFNKKYGF